MQRREFLCASTVFFLADPVLSMGEVMASEALVLTVDEWQQIAAVQEYLFPSEPNAPGAREIHALSYLRFALSREKRPRDLELLLADGLQRLRQLSLSEGPMGRHGFSGLDNERKEAVLRELEGESVGRDFLATLLHYILEACLTDPVYGGNPHGIGWHWLDFQPGHRRPTEEKRYFLLSQ